MVTSAACPWVRPGDTITLSSALVLLVTPPRPLLQRLRYWQEHTPEQAGSYP